MKRWKVIQGKRIKTTTNQQRCQKAVQQKKRLLGEIKCQHFLKDHRVWKPEGHIQKKREGREELAAQNVGRDVLPRTRAWLRPSGGRRGRSLDPGGAAAAGGVWGRKQMSFPNLRQSFVVRALVSRPAKFLSELLDTRQGIREKIEL